MEARARAPILFLLAMAVAVGGVSLVMPHPGSESPSRSAASTATPSGPSAADVQVPVVLPEDAPVLLESTSDPADQPASDAPTPLAQPQAAPSASPQALLPPEDPLLSAPGLLAVVREPGTHLVIPLFSGAVPDLSGARVPVGWTLSPVPFVQVTPVQAGLPPLPVALPTPTVPAALPDPTDATVRPGVLLLVAHDGGTLVQSTCIAGFVWKDQDARVLLSTAGHCLLEGEGRGGPGADLTKVRVWACAACSAQPGMEVPATAVELGRVAYARQAADDGDMVGHDLGLIVIPDNTTVASSPASGPTPSSKGSAASGDLVFLERKGAERTGPLMDSAASKLAVAAPSSAGDSGTPLVASSGFALGHVTHRADVPGLSSVTLGLPNSRVPDLADEADLCVRMVEGDEDVADAPSPAPTARCPPADGFPLVALPNGPYYAGLNETLWLSGSASGGIAPYSCFWTGLGTTFDNATRCDARTRYLVACDHPLTLTVTDSRGHVAKDDTFARIDGASCLAPAKSGDLAPTHPQDGTNKTVAAKDSDRDTLGDGKDNCPLVPNLNQTDTDHDGSGDECDVDMDGDKVRNERDNCPLVMNPQQEDIDLDAVGDRCDDDLDGDTVMQPEDNCPLLRNLDQADADEDGSGDLCDLDEDGDGLPDRQDADPNVADAAPTAGTVWSNHRPRPSVEVAAPPLRHPIEWFVPLVLAAALVMLVGLMFVFRRK